MRADGNQPADANGGPGGDDLARRLAAIERELAEAHSENARLREDAREAERRQTATGDVLRAIAASAADVGPALAMLAQTVCRLCRAHDAVIMLKEEDRLRVVAHHGPIPLQPGTPVGPVSRDWPPGRAVVDGAPVHAPDLATDPEFPLGRAMATKAQQAYGGDGETGLAWRTALAVPLLREGGAVGVIALRRTEVSPFSESQIALLATFADQAAIAVENARLFAEVQAKTSDLEESLAQQTATAEVLKTINRSAFDLDAVLDALTETARRLCGAANATVFIRDGDLLRLRAHARCTPDFVAFLEANPIPASRATFSGRVLLTGDLVHIPDVEADPEYDFGAAPRLGHFRSALGVPLLRDGRVEGVFALARPEPGAFTERQIDLVRAFADQAMIAIENARLLSEVRDALERERASAEILGAVSQSVADAGPVFERITEACARLFGVSDASIWRIDDDGMVRMAAGRGALVERGRNDVTPLDRSYTGRVARTRQVLHIPDQSREPDLSEAMRERLRLAGGVSLFYAPIIAENQVIGSLGAVRSPPRPFSDKELALARTFADQAAIAIENARLFAEVQAKTRDLEESLAQQTATAEVLQTISRSVFDLDTVLRTLIDTAVRLCRGSRGTIFIRNGDRIEARGFHSNVPEGLRDYILANPLSIGGQDAISTTVREGMVIHNPDVASRPWLIPAAAREQAAFGAVLCVPLMREGEAIGCFAMPRNEPLAFSAREIELVKTFADQAVIAIENARLFTEVQARTRDLTEALQQQTATADVLKVISRSAFDLQAVFDTLVASAVELVGGVDGTIFVREGESFAARAHKGVAPGWANFLAATRPTPGRHSATARVLLSGKTESIPDVLADADYTLPSYALNRSRSLLATPMLREDRIEGVLVVGREQPGEFTKRQIELVQSFADQAVIAIENVRLFDEVQAKTRDLQESLAQQTATADVLKVISQSPANLQPVLDAIADTAARLCGSDMTMFFRFDGRNFRILSSWNFPEDVRAMLEAAAPEPGHPSALGRAGTTLKPAYIPDVLADPDYGFRTEQGRARYRATLAVPMLREGKLVGALSLNRAEPGSFTAKHIELVSTFADQAAIAFENVRLFNETQAKTRDLEESLAQQTATADVLKVISQSAFDLDAVFSTLLAAAVQLIGGAHGTLCVHRDDRYRYVAFHGLPENFVQWLIDNPPTPGSASSAGRVLASGKITIIPDVPADAEFLVPADSLGQFLSVLAAPLLRDGAVEGVLIITRREAGDFTARQVELVQTFADQAVIAIENVRLFKEVQDKTRDLEESLAQQTATADVLKIISRSAFDLDPVFSTLIERAARLCGANRGTIFLRDGDGLVPAALHGMPAGTREALVANPLRVDDSSAAGRAVLSRDVCLVTDVAADPAYRRQDLASVGRYRSIIGVPLMQDGEAIGAFSLPRAEPGGFTERQIETLRTFADQAVIAIGNARLFNQVQARTKELAASLDDLRRTQDRLVQSEKLASLGQLTAGIAHEIKNPLNFINNFSALSRELMEELREVVDKAGIAGEARDEADELIGMIDANLDKVVSHGKRADSIVKNMLLHSREGSGERGPVAVNAMVEEALNLAYHGARAEKRGFNVTIEKALDPTAGEAELYPQEMTRVLLNLISNGFYATTKRGEAGGGAGFEPTIFASTRDLGHTVEIVIRDNGTGIPDDVKAKMFNPFFTTKPAGEGTGLGLSLSHDIVVKQHGGTIEVATVPGAGTAFTITLPRSGARA